MLPRNPPAAPARPLTAAEHELKAALRQGYIDHRLAAGHRPKSIAATLQMVDTFGASTGLPEWGWTVEAFDRYSAALLSLGNRALTIRSKQQAVKGYLAFATDEAYGYRERCAQLGVRITQIVRRSNSRPHHRNAERGTRRNLSDTELTTLFNAAHAETTKPRLREIDRLAAQLRYVIPAAALCFATRANELVQADYPRDLPPASGATKAFSSVAGLEIWHGKAFNGGEERGHFVPAIALFANPLAIVDWYLTEVRPRLKNALRGGDVWVPGSRQFKDFDEYLLPRVDFDRRHSEDLLGLPVPTSAKAYLDDRLALLREELDITNKLAAAGELPDVEITEKGLKISPIEDDTPDDADALRYQAYHLLPRVKITDLLLEVDRWTKFSRMFAHLKTGEEHKDHTLLLTAILADAFNLGLEKMVDACPGTSLARLSWLVAWHIRDETYSKALAELVDYQHRLPLATHWGEGITSSSDGQRFRAGGHGEAAGYRNAKYGDDPGVLFYTHISDQYAPFHTKVISSPVRDATHVLDGLLYHESDLRIEEHYTDTAGFTDHVFGLCHLLGFTFAPRIADLADKNLYVPGKPSQWPALLSLISTTPLQLKLAEKQFPEALRLATSIKHGTVTASLILRKLGAYPRQNGLALALREIGRIERTIFTLKWLQEPALRRRVSAGLNKGEARNALARAVFFQRLGEIRDRSYENQRNRASGLNLVTATIVLWNTVYLERAIAALRQHREIDDALLSYIAPLGWNHVNLTGDYRWQGDKRVAQGQFRPLRRPLPSARRP